MDVQLTVIDGVTGATADVRAVAPDTASAVDLLDAVRAAVGASPATIITLRGRALLDDGAVADCPLHDGAVLTLGGPDHPSTSTPSPDRTRPAVLLATSGGPDAGRQLTIGNACSIIGRGAGCDLSLNDPTISRQHLRVSRDSSSVTALELGSANGASVDGVSMRPDRSAALAVGETIAIGDTELRVMSIGERPPDRATHAEPHVVRRAPRLPAPTPPTTIDFPPLPTPPIPVRLPIVAALTPLAVGVVLSLLLHQWQLLAFTALSPVMIGGQAIGDRWHRRRTIRTDNRRHATATAAAASELASALHRERRQRRREAPDLATLSLAVTGRGPLLWQRTADCPDLLRLRLGRGDAPAMVQVTGRPTPTLTDVPICVDLRETPVLGICGHGDQTRGLLRSLLIQAAALHPPDQLRLVILGNGRAHEWAWTRWLPHLTPHQGEGPTALVGFDREQIADRVDELLDDRPHHHEPATLVVVDLPSTGLRSRTLTRLDAFVSSGHRTVAVIWRADQDGDLPRSCDAIARLSGSCGRSLELQRIGHLERVAVAPDLVALDTAEDLSRAIAPLRASGHQVAGQLPRTVAWRSHTGLDLNDTGATTRFLLRRWSGTPTTDVVLGLGADGPVTVDIRLDGPHCLVAGTTGAGKSELLLSLVASLVAANRPDRLSLLLLDHKGGATFAPCARLPHTVGVLTDLDVESTQRALASLTAEVRRRETQLAAAGAVDLESYAAAAGPDADPMPRLVIVIDEFAALAEEQPEFVGGLVGIAQRGRSLGLHLVLATQRPEGVVSADIRANTRIRICLGVAREAESRDVIDSPDAAGISRLTPGRGFLRVGPGDLREFQSGRVTAGQQTSVPPAVTLLPAAALGAARLAPPESASEQSDLTALIDAAIAADSQLGCRRPTPPWLPPLPRSVTVRELPPGPATSVGWGLVDLPHLGQQHRLDLDLSVGATTVIAGTARSGRTTAAVTITIAAAGRLSPSDLHVWAIDASAGLRALSDLPHCGAVVPAHDVERVDRVLESAINEVAERRRNPSRGRRRTLMLVIDSWEALASAGSDGPRLTDTLLQLAADGPSAGLHLVVTADRAGLTGRLAAVASERLILRLADPADLALIGIPLRAAPRDLPPGRGIRATDQALVQVATATDDCMAAAGRWPLARPGPRRFDPLPARVTLDQLNATADPAELVLGAGADDLSRVTVDIASMSNGLMVAGPPGSGRTSALMVLARQLTGRRLLVCCPSGSPLLAESNAIHLPPDDQAHAIALLDSLEDSTVPPPHLLVDDLDRLGDGPLLARLDELVRPHNDPGRAVIVASLTETFSGAFRGPAARIRQARAGVLLCPGLPTDGDLLGLRLTRRSLGNDPPGRGWFVQQGRTIRLQLAVADVRPDRRAAGAEVSDRDYPSTELELSPFGDRSRE